jgi:hypothetical protein
MPPIDLKPSKSVAVDETASEFGTVRLLGQIPGPDQNPNPIPASLLVQAGRRITAGSQFSRSVRSLVVEEAVDVAPRTPHFNFDEC